MAHLAPSAPISRSEVMTTAPQRAPERAPRSAPLTIERPETSHGGPGGPLVAHIIDRDKAADAYIFGHEVEALCGYRWVPSRDPKGLPVCPLCRAELEHRHGGDVPVPEE
jgi:hypothetical protein